MKVDYSYLMLLCACISLCAMEEPQQSDRPIGFFNDIAFPTRPDDDAWRTLFDELKNVKTIFTPDDMDVFRGKFRQYYPDQNSPMYQNFVEFRAHNAFKIIKKASRDRKSFLDTKKHVGSFSQLCTETAIYSPDSSSSWQDIIIYAQFNNRCELHQLRELGGGSPDDRLVRGVTRGLLATECALVWARWVVSERE